jgi:glutamate synthase domain-containing protein 2
MAGARSVAAAPPLSSQNEVGLQLMEALPATCSAAGFAPQDTLGGSGKLVTCFDFRRIFALGADDATCAKVPALAWGTSHARYPDFHLGCAQ